VLSLTKILTIVRSSLIDGKAVEFSRKRTSRFLGKAVRLLLTAKRHKLLSHAK